MQGLGGAIKVHTEVSIQSNRQFELRLISKVFHYKLHLHSTKLSLGTASPKIPAVAPATKAFPLCFGLLTGAMFSGSNKILISTFWMLKYVLNVDPISN